MFPPVSSSAPGVISIHAPVKGATSDLNRPLPMMGISIHAPVKGATSLSISWDFFGIFQSTHP